MTHRPLRGAAAAARPAARSNPSRAESPDNASRQAAPPRRAGRLARGLGPGLLAALAAAGPAWSQAGETPPAQALETTGADIVVTPNRGPSSLQRSGSAVTVVTGEEIARTNPATVVDALRGLPGLDVTASGPAGTTTLRIRGAESRHTLVLVDGVRVNDPSSTGGEFDFANFVPADIERIEVLRGPQSALYGSDAIGGVVNIITRRGRGEPRATLQAEAGTYRTGAVRAGVSGGTADTSYALSVNGVRSEGFSAYGARIPRLAGFGPFDRDAYARLGGSGRVAWRPVDGIELEVGASSSRTRSEYDAAFAGFGYLPDTPSRASAWLSSAYGRLTASTFEGFLTHRLTVTGSRTERTLDDVQRYDFGFGLTEEGNRYGFRGERTGIEWQGDLDFRAFGKLTLGAAAERETFRSTVLPGPNSFNAPDRAAYERDNRALFALHQVALGPLDLSVGGRVDDVGGVRTFVTGRATAAWRIAETGTKLRGSVGTGAKAPSLYQQFSIYGPLASGDPALDPERSFGVDAGLDQTLFDGRALLSATLFRNRIRDLIDFDFNRGTVGPFGPIGQYLNVARATTQGLELSLDARLHADWARVRASYTRLDARDASTGLELARRPRDSGRLSLVLTPDPRWTFEPSLVLVGERFSSPNERDRLAPYARLDARVDYRLSETVSLYARGENLTNARYQEIRDYGTTGRAGYAGLRAVW